MTTEEMIQALEALLETQRAKPVSATPEPDPWPTEPLIVADWVRESGAKGSGLLVGGDDTYLTEHGELLDAEVGDTLTNVVPVTIVPVAALPVLWSALEQWLNNANRIPPSEETHRLVGAVESLRGQIDALGVDL